MPTTEPDVFAYGLWVLPALLGRSSASSGIVSNTITSSGALSVDAPLASITRTCIFFMPGVFTFTTTWPLCVPPGVILTSDAGSTTPLTTATAFTAVPLLQMSNGSGTSTFLFSLTMSLYGATPAFCMSISTKPCGFDVISYCFRLGLPGAANAAFAKLSALAAASAA